MKLTELEPQFLKRVDDVHHQTVETINEADGIRFVCPRCLVDKGARPGCHPILCWRPHVPQTTTPIPGRWEFEGVGYGDLTLVAGSPSVHLTSPGGCGAHFYIRNGEVTFA